MLRLKPDNWNFSSKNLNQFNLAIQYKNIEGSSPLNTALQCISMVRSISFSKALFLFIFLQLKLLIKIREK